MVFDEEEMRRDNLALRRRIFFLPDFPLVLGAMTPVQHIGTMLKLYQSDMAGIEQRAFQLLSDFDLLPICTKPLAYLSRGQIYKSALVGLMTVDPPVWILDEPFASGIDPHGITALKREIRAAAGRKRTIIYSTQILEIAEKFSDRIAIISKGELRAFDSLAGLRAKTAPGSDDVLTELFVQLREEKER
jgi:ABC-type multidrug transport system ATPase subunit